VRKRTFQLTNEQLNELQGAYQQCDEGATKIRYQAVRLYGNGYATEEVMAITGCSRRRLLAWCRNYRLYGVAGLVDRRAGGNSAKLSASEVEAIQHKLQQYRPNQLFSADAYQGNGEFWGVAEVALLLERAYGVVYQSKTSYRNLLDRCGMSRQRPAAQYKSRNEAKVMAAEEELEKNYSTRPRQLHTP
jgi:transposase